jgi:hypothetical protein
VAVEGSNMLDKLKEQLLNVFFENEVREETWHSKRSFTPNGENGKYYLNRNAGKSEYISDNGNTIERDTSGYDLDGNVVAQIPAGSIVKLLKTDDFAKQMPVYGPIESIDNTSMVPVNFNGKQVYVAIAYIKKHKTKTQNRVASGDSAQVSISAALQKKFPGIKILAVAKKGSNSGDIKLEYNGIECEIEVKGTTSTNANVTFFDKTYFYEEYQQYLAGNANQRTVLIDSLIDANAAYKQALPNKKFAAGNLNLIKVIESFRTSGNKEVGFAAQDGVAFASGIIPIAWFAQHADPIVYKKHLQSKMAKENYFCLIDTSTKTAYLWFNEVSAADPLNLGNVFPEVSNCKLKTYRNQGPQRLSVGFNCRVNVNSNKPVIIPL